MSSGQVSVSSPSLKTLPRTLAHPDGLPCGLRVPIGRLSHSALQAVGILYIDGSGRPARPEDTGKRWKRLSGRRSPLPGTMRTDLWFRNIVTIWWLICLVNGANSRSSLSRLTSVLVNADGVSDGTDVTDVSGKWKVLMNMATCQFQRRESDSAAQFNWTGGAHKQSLWMRWERSSFV